MRLQSSHRHAERGLDAYFSPPEAVAALLHVETGRLPRCIWEPAAGDGAIARPLRAAGFHVLATDLASYGLEGCDTGIDYLKAKRKPNVQAVVTNPPYRLAVPFAEKALEETAYVAFLLRTNFLEGTARLPFFRRHQPARIWVSSRRLPMMHRYGWQGPRAPSNTCYAWFVWDACSEQKRVVDWFDWKQVMPHQGTSDLFGSSRCQLDGAAQVFSRCILA